MIPEIHGKPNTPTRFAKYQVLSYGEGAHYWRDRFSEEDLDAITEREGVLIDAQVEKHWRRIERFLGL